VHWNARVWLIKRLPAGNEKLVDDAARDRREGKCSKSAAHSAARVAVNQTAHEDLVERGSRHNAKLACF
jgi:hypothetical protein